MGFYIRKSFKLGPLRFNLSKSGVGMSAGVKGARAGVDATGKPYVHTGRGGFYFRKVFRSADTANPQPAMGVSAGLGVLLLVVVALLVVVFLFMR